MVFGPLPPPASKEDEEKAAEEYALRRIALEEEAEAQKNTSKREEWMLELPKKLTNYGIFCCFLVKLLGLGARTISKGGGAKKDSSWTDAPGAKKRRVEEEEPVDRIAQASQRVRDEEQQQLANQMNVGFFG